MNVKEYKKSKLPSWYKKANYSCLASLNSEDLICLIKDRLDVYESYKSKALNLHLYRKVLKDPLQCHQAFSLFKGLKQTANQGLYIGDIERRPVVALSPDSYSLNIEHETITLPSCFVDIDSESNPRMLFISDLTAPLDAAVESFKKSYKEVQSTRQIKNSSHKDLSSFHKFVIKHRFIEFLDIELYSIISGVGYSDSDFVNLLKLGKDRSTYTGVLKPKFNEVLTRQFISKLLNMI